jgi:DNA-binding transcriptional ArsR family regulator
MIEIDNNKLRQTKLKIYALSNDKRQRIISSMYELKDAQKPFKIALKARLSQSVTQNHLNVLVNCGFVAKLSYYEGYRYLLNDMIIKEFLNKMQFEETYTV